MKVASTCNLACDYCYASRNFNKGNKWINKDLVSILFEQLGVSSYGRIDFDLHGGEPLTWDISDFNNFFHKQNLLKQRSNKDIVSRIQVNGTLITSRMAKYLKEMNIEVGVSLDGPQVIHDIHRQFKAGNGSFSSTIQGIGILVENDCEFEILSVVTNELAQNVKSAFEFFSELVDTSNMLLKSINFLPSFEIDPDSRTLLSSSITPDQYVNFLIPFFDMWFENDSEDFHISLFEEIIAVLLGGKANTCNFRRGCNGFLTLEPDGSVYPCDRFSGIQEFRLGNLFEDSLPKILASDAYKKYNERVENYPEECLHCEWQKLCQGGCLYHAWALNPTINEPSYYCGGLKKIFQHIEDTLIENLDNYERYLRPETMN